ILRIANDFVEAAKLPAAQAEKRFKAIEKRISSEAFLVQLTASPFLMMREADRQMQAHLCCAVAALAIERYRLSQGHWPASLDHLVSDGFLDAVPTDPYADQPIRLKRTADGL